MIEEQRRAQRAEMRVTWEQRARQVYVARACGATWKDIAAEFGVSSSFVAAIDARVQHRIDKCWRRFFEKAADPSNLEPTPEELVLLHRWRFTREEREACARIALRRGSPEIAAAIRNRRAPGEADY